MGGHATPLSKDYLLRIKKLLERELQNENIDSNRQLAIQEEITLINSCLLENKVSQEEKPISAKKYFRTELAALVLS